MSDAKLADRSTSLSLLYPTLTLQASFNSQTISKIMSTTKVGNNIDDKEVIETTNS